MLALKTTIIIIKISVLLLNSLELYVLAVVCHGLDDHITGRCDLTE